jgi:hypothetical protein
MADLINAPDEGNPSEITTPEVTIPERYQGKSFEEVIEMHRNLEKKLAEQGEELGSLRALAEETVASVGSSKGDDDADSVDFFDDPEKAVERIIERKLAPLSGQVAKQQEAVVRERLDKSFPGWKETVKSDEFQEWVADSRVRTQLFISANQSNWDACNELLSTWQEISGASNKTEEAATKAVARDRKLRAAKTETGSAGVDPRKILNRSDLRSLKQNNPTRYNELLPDIRKAYQEGRVR